MLHQKIVSMWDVAAGAQCSVEYISALSQAAQLALEELLSLSRQSASGAVAIPTVHLTQTLLHLLDEQVRLMNEQLETIANAT